MYFTVEFINSIRPSLPFREKLNLIEEHQVEIDIKVVSSVQFRLYWLVRFYWLEIKNGAFAKPSLDSISMAINFWQFEEEGLPHTHRHRYHFGRALSKTKI